MSDIVKTGVSDYGAKPTHKPSGNVCTDGKMSTIKDLPARSVSPDSVPEVTYDENMGLPSRSGSK